MNVTKEFRTEQRKLNEEIEKTVEGLKQSASDKAFEYKLFGKSDHRQMHAYSEQASLYKTQATGALAAGEIEKADKLISQAIEYQKESMKFSESIAKEFG